MCCHQLTKRIVLTESVIAVSALLLLARWVRGRFDDMESQRAIAEMRAEVQREWLEATLANIGDAVITADQHGRVEFLNPAAAQFLGVEADTALGQPISDFVEFVDVGTHEQLESPLRQALASEQPVVAGSESAIRLPDGRLRPVEASVTPIKDAAGRLVGGVMVLRDASHRREHEFALRQAYAELDRRAGERRAALERAAAALRESTALLQTFAASTPELIFAKDREGRILMVNPAALQALGLSREQVIGRQDIVLFGSPEDDRRVREADRRIVDNGEAVTVEQSQVTAAGTRTYLVTKSPLRDEQSQVIGIVGVATDITERNRAQRELEHLLVAEHRLRGEAERASRAKDEFLAVVSHELRSPLNALKGWSHILSSTRNPDASLVIRAAQAIRRNVEHQTRLIDDLLDTSRIISGKLEIERRPVNMVEVVHAAIDLSRTSALSKKIDLRVSADHPVISVDGDHGRLQQVVINLLSNAIKFTPENGRVEVKLQRIGERVDLVVADTGIGIEPEFLPHVFDRFSQADSSTIRRYRGLGIGLALVRYLVELHGGTVWAASPGTDRGATFTVELPALKTAAGGGLPNEPGEGGFMPGEALRGIQVLLVDDDSDARDVMQIALANAGAKVQAFESGSDLLAMLRDAEPWTSPAVLLLDIAMPGDDGFDVLARARALDHLPFIPAIAVTALTYLDRRQLAMAGFQNCLGKPVDVERLIETIIAVAGRSGTGVG